MRVYVTLVLQTQALWNIKINIGDTFTLARSMKWSHSKYLFFMILDSCSNRASQVEIKVIALVPAPKSWCYLNSVIHCTNPPPPHCTVSPTFFRELIQRSVPAMLFRRVVLMSMCAPSRSVLAYLPKVTCTMLWTWTKRWPKSRRRKRLWSNPHFSSVRGVLRSM